MMRDSVFKVQSIIIIEGRFSLSSDFGKLMRKLILFSGSTLKVGRSIIAGVGQKEAKRARCGAQVKHGGQALYSSRICTDYLGYNSNNSKSFGSLVIV